VESEAFTGAWPLTTEKQAMRWRQELFYKPAGEPLQVFFFSSCFK
jgi:hypothetical protein